MTARDIRYGRRGGRWASPPQSAKDLASIEAFKAEREALAAAAECRCERCSAAGEQLELFAQDQVRSGSSR